MKEVEGCIPQLNHRLPPSLVYLLGILREPGGRALGHPFKAVEAELLEHSLLERLLAAHRTGEHLGEGLNAYCFEF